MRSPAAAVRRLLLVLAVFILAVYTIVQAINRPVAGDVTTYRAEFSDVFGLRENGDVRVRGVQVGKVVDIELQRSGLALVTFTVRDADRLKAGDRLAIRFQNLVGQRYLAVTHSGEKDSRTPQGDTPLNPDTVIPASMTDGSFDITRLFNGLRPLLQGADPAVFNRFADNMIKLLQGENGVGVGDVLGDIEKLSAFATDKQDLIRAIVNNLGVVADQLTGKASIIENLMANMGKLFDTLEVNLELLKGAFGEGSKVFPPIVEVMKSAFDLSLGGHDNVQARLMELIPDTTKLTETLSLIPTLLSNLNAGMGRLGTDISCSKGQVPLPALSYVLIGGEKVTLCRA